MDKLPFFMRHPRLNILRKLRGLWRQAKRCLSILPVAWNAHPWDYTGALRLLQWQFQQMEPEIRAGIALRSEATADQIKSTVKLLERILEDYYMSEVGHKAISKRWDEMEEIEGPDGMTRMYFKDDPSTIEFINQEHHLAWLREKKDWNDLFTHLRRHLKHWWD